MDQTSTSQTIEQEPITELPEGFMVFYDQFHSDSLFQLNRISFPLAGRPSRADLDMPLTDFRWTREGWKVHQPFDENDDTYDRNFHVISPELIIERMVSPTYGYYLERRWAVLSDGWNLIYYADVQEPKVQEK